MSWRLLDDLFLWFLIYAFAGWVYESILVSVQQRRPVNRGFLNGPLVPIYGVGAVAGVMLLGGIRSATLLFIASAVGASVLEYVTSWVMEKAFHARWWDYSNFRFNLNGRVCLLGAVIFGVGGVVVVRFVQPHVAALTAMLTPPALHWLTLVLFALFVADLTVTISGMIDFERRLEQLVSAVAPVMEQYGGAARNVGETVRQTVDGAVGGVSAAAAKVGDLSARAASRVGERVGGHVGERVGESLRGGKEMSLEMMLRVRDLAVSVLNTQQRRMIASFPKLRTDRERSTAMLRQLRETFEKLRRRKP